MKVLNRIKLAMLRFWRSQIPKYLVVCIAGILIVGFFDENSVWSHVKNRERINELEKEKEKYDAEFRRDQARIRELQKNPKAIRKIARERYFMKEEDEDIFVLSDENDAPQIVDYEAAN